MELNLRLISKERKRAFIIKYLPNLTSKFQKFLYSSIKWEFVGIENGLKVEKPVVIAFFHGRMLMLPFFYNILRPNRKIKMIVSNHFDGTFIGKVVSYLGIEILQGSSTRGGTRLLKQILNLKNFDIGITPDGPKGPGEKVKNGVIFISKVTGFPILPVTYSVKHKKILNTWDRFLIPRPFSKGVFICGEPIYLPENLDDNEFEHYKNILEEKLKKINNLAEGMAQKL